MHPCWKKLMNKMLEDMTNDLNHSNYKKLRTSLILDPFDHIVYNVPCKDFILLYLKEYMQFFQVYIN